MLTDADCRNARCPPEKARLRLSDSGNLYLQIEPNGSRRWFWKYTVGGKEKRISLGHYTEAGSSKVQMSLKAAREARDTARSVHRTGVDPAPIPAANMKRTVQGKLSGRPHLVPLAPRAVQIFREVHPMTGHGDCVFPSLLTGERRMSENTIRTALRRMGYSVATEWRRSGHPERSASRSQTPDMRQ